jgi:FixJ family two-component response regulator
MASKKITLSWTCISCAATPEGDGAFSFDAYLNIRKLGCPWQHSLISLERYCHMNAIGHQLDLVPALPLDSKLIATLPTNQRSTIPTRETVYLIHEDLQLCQTLSTLLVPFQLEVFRFSSIADCLKRGNLREASCLLIDLQVHDSDCVSLGDWLSQDLCLPVIFISDLPDVAGAVRAMKMGAIEVFTKLVDPAVMVEAIQFALVQNRKRQLRKTEMERLRTRYALLSPRERDVVPLIVGGLLNKQAASVLGISLITLQVHKRQVMRKMKAESLADLVRMSMKLRLPYWRGGHFRAA